MAQVNVEAIETLDFKKDKLPVINYKVQMFANQIKKLKQKAGLELDESSEVETPSQFKILAEFPCWVRTLHIFGILCAAVQAST